MVVGFFFSIYLFLVGGSSHYNIVLVSAIHRHESATGIHVSPLSILFFFFFSFIFISWRLITLQYCSGFCHTLTWISHVLNLPSTSQPIPSRRLSQSSLRHPSYFHWLSDPGGSDDKESACNVGDLASVAGSGRSPGEGNGYLIQCSCLDNPMDRGACWATVHGIAESDLSEQLSRHLFYTW